MILKPGEKVFIAVRRHFETDTRRHFVGEVETCTDQAVRVVGYVFVLNTSNHFEKRLEQRVRIFPLSGERLIINVIPPSTLLEKVQYTIINDRLHITDGCDFSYDVDEFRKG